jgi:SAM-dependent MidA family methyltransferase
MPLIRETFPPPDAAALAVSAALVERIEAAIDAGGGWLDFERFMQMALYEPGLGYYSAGARKLGPKGDFTTAPEQSDWLARALAAFIGDQLTLLDSTNVLELGAGSGRLAAVLVRELAARGRTDIEYAILEPSADLRERQVTLLAPLPHRIVWLDALPATPFTGVVLANEVADAIPVARFVKKAGAVLPLGVARQADGLAIVPGPPDAALGEAVARIETEIGAPLPNGYRSEIRLLLGPWLAGVLGAIAAGGLLLIDYGLPQREYYRTERADGTLICHYRHRPHGDALLWPGLQDISAWVDFSALAAAGRDAGFALSGYTTQAQFLLGTVATDPALAPRQPSARAASALKTLILPGEMGERFKLIWLTRGMPATALPGRDFRNRL